LVSFYLAMILGVLPKVEKHGGWTQSDLEAAESVT